MGSWAHILPRKAGEGDHPQGGGGGSHRLVLKGLSALESGDGQAAAPSTTSGGPPPPFHGGGFALAILALLLATPARAADITITAPWLRATPKGAPVAGGYATITNNGAAPDKLLGASIPMAPEGQVHSMSMANGVMHMERLANGLPIAPGVTVQLTPGGYHLMFLKPKALLKEGETVQGTLNFEKAGAVPVTFPVAGFGAKQAPGQ